jgi:hypothetical protein
MQKSDMLKFVLINSSSDDHGVLTSSKLLLDIFSGPVMKLYDIHRTGVASCDTMIRTRYYLRRRVYECVVYSSKVANILRSRGYINNALHTLKSSPGITSN